jgi:hypothetical protein
MIFYHVFLWLHGKSSTISSIDCYYQGMKWMAMKHEVQPDDKYIRAFGNHMKFSLEHLRHARDSIKLSNLIFHSSHFQMLHVNPSLGG